MPRKTPEGRRDAILNAARAIFAARGYAGARLEDVAAGAGISKAALYLQFADKAALFCEMIDWMVDSILPVAMPSSLAAGSPQGQLETLVGAVSQQLGRPEIAFLPKLVIAESGNFPEVARAYHDRVIRRVLALIQGILERGIADGSFRPVDTGMAARSLAGGLLLGMLWKSVLEPVGADPVDLAALGAAHVDVILNGLIDGGAA